MAEHTPLRMCIGCRQMYPKKDLIKIVSKDGVCSIDPEQKKPGRGAYLCRNAACIEQAKKKRALSKHFKMQIAQSLYDEAKELLDG